MGGGGMDEERVLLNSLCEKAIGAIYEVSNVPELCRYPAPSTFDTS